MKTIRLVEAPTTASANTTQGDITSWEAEWADPTQDKLDVARNILNDVNIDSNIINKILSFGNKFVVDWINAMRLDEIARKNNEFINLLKEDINKKEDTILRNKENFIKVYNVYATNLMDIDYLKDDLYKTILTDTGMYSRSEDDFREVYKYYDNLKSKNYSNEDIRKILLEEGTDKVLSNAQIIENAAALKDPEIIARRNVEQVKQDIKKYAKALLDGMDEAGFKDAAELLRKDLPQEFLQEN